MFIEKNRRYFRRYKIKLKPRTKFAPPLPLTGPVNQHNAFGAISKAWKDGRAVSYQPNGDLIDLIAIDHSPTDHTLTLLFHRASPDAADPAYRKRIADKVTVRQAKKDADEEQAVSCHLVISTKLTSGYYNAVLEEIPGLSASAVLAILARILNTYEYPYVRNKKSLVTTTVFRAEGTPSETLSETLKKKGSLNYLTLTRSVPNDVPDSNGVVEPKNERVKYRIVGNPSDPDWKKRFKEFVEGAKAKWEQVSVEVTLDDDRRRTIRVDQEQEASEVLFVRSEQVVIKEDLTPCSMSVVPAVVTAARKLLKSG